MSCKVDCEPHYCKIGMNNTYLSSTVLFAAGIGGMSSTMSGPSQHWAGRKCYVIEDLVLGGFNKSCIIIPQDRRCCVGQISWSFPALSSAVAARLWKSTTGSSVMAA